MNPESLIQQSKRIVIKIGSAILTNEETGTVRHKWLKTLCDDIAMLSNQGKEIAIVSSGAIALGRKALKIKNTIRPSSISLDKKQAAASIGQVIMSQTYADCFATHQIQTGLVLLSPKDTEERRAHLNARATLSTLLENSIVPIINENDTVSTEEIRFGDNDRLASRVAQMIDADLVIQLSTIDGLYTGDPTQDDNAEHIPLVEELSSNITNMAGDAPAGLSTGGMKSKLEAARIATKAGVHMMITSGKIDHPLSKINRATIFTASTKSISARKKWISSHVKPKGIIVIDTGAANALSQGKSLLAAGIVSIEGDFIHGDPVEILDQNDVKLAIGLSNYSTQESQKITGKNSADIDQILGYTRGNEIIHRANLVLT